MAFLNLSLILFLNGKYNTRDGGGQGLKLHLHHDFLQVRPVYDIISVFDQQYKAVPVRHKGVFQVIFTVGYNMFKDILCYRRPDFSHFPISKPSSTKIHILALYPRFVDIFRELISNLSGRSFSNARTVSF
jgi:hypothetical protein